jgi:hypothetical protein
MFSFDFYSAFFVVKVFVFILRVERLHLVNGVAVRRSPSPNRHPSCEGRSRRASERQDTFQHGWFRCFVRYATTVSIKK